MEIATNNNHLNSDQLNEYLDNTLSPMEKTIVETHMASCDECKEIMVGLESLLSRLILLDEIKIEKNLAPGVLNRIRLNRDISTVFKWGTLLQLCVVFVGLIVLVRYGFQQPFLTIIPFNNLRMDVNIQDFILNLTSEIISGWTSFQLTLAGAFKGMKISPNLQFTQGTIWVLFISAGLLLLIGNGFVLGNINKHDI
jgi:predicted anti-sigma-YlaC factor YlaD